MPKESLRYFFVFLFLSLLIFSLSKLNLLDLPESYLSKITTTVSSPFFSLGDFFASFSEKSSEESLKEENLTLQKKLVDQKKLIDENKALHDQFQVSNPRALSLLPARVVGAAKFIPGIFQPETFVIDKGTAEGIKAGNAVIFKDNLVGIVTKTSKLLSQVTLTTNPTLKFTAKTQNGVLGVVKGEGNGELFLDNVLLSDILEKGDLVLTSGDIKIDQTGTPPDIIVGKVVSVEANPSDLFQRAKLEILLDFSKITKVFVIRGFE